MNYGVVYRRVYGLGMGKPGMYIDRGGACDTVGWASSEAGVIVGWAGDVINVDRGVAHTGTGGNAVKGILVTGVVSTPKFTCD